VINEGQFSTEFYRMVYPLPVNSRRAIARCYQCNGRFGLVRHRFALKQFCSKHCVENYRANADRTISREKVWKEFLFRK
jgi:hypothetical protein